ncbi:MAG TPA: DNA polymerase III subunit delta [Patescibacteria group bacterium]|jgi:DNA polymerase-3 subunit delta|nr:DNA polymerase III subunit delta [Patescibacteria group bacterium]
MIVTLTGPNNFAARQALETIAKQFKSKYGGDSIERVDGESFDLNRLPELLTGMTLFSTNRLIIMRRMAQDKAVWDSLADWLPRLSDDTTLIVVEPVLDKRTKTFKLLKKVSDFREFAELSERDLISWLQKTAVALGGSIDNATSRHLIQQVGLQQERLWQELQKLINYKPQITTSTVDDLIEPNLQVNVFELLDYALGGKPTQMQSMMDKMRVNEDPYKLFGLLVSQVYTLAVVTSAGSKSSEAIAQETGTHPFVVRKAQALALQPTRVKKMIDMVAELDTSLKSSGVEPWLLLEQCLNKICFS